MRKSSQTWEKSTATALIVDDDDLVRWALAESLKDSGYRVCEAASGREAVTAILAAPEPFDVVLLDYRLPDSSDLMLLNRLRSLSPASKVVMLTGYGTPTLLESAIALGARCVVPKPFDVVALTALLSRV
jgi:DNA-binding NtrC family response regulator